MAQFQWNDSYSVHVPEMDRQHKKLFELISQLGEAMSKGQGRDILGKIIDELLAYTRTHFTAEEKLLARANYTGLETQKAMHKTFVAKVTEFKQQCQSGSVSLSVNVSAFMNDWLRTHICKEDVKYGPVLNAVGVA